MQRSLFTQRHLMRTQVRLGKLGFNKVSRCRNCPAQSLQGPLQSDGSYLTDKVALSDGPDLFMIRSDARTASNLGAIQDSLKGQPSDADIKAMQEVPNRGSAFEGIYFDGPAVLGSSVLLSVLLFLSLERVLGLNRWLMRVRQSWDERKQDEEKWAVYDARRRLEEIFNSTDEAADDKS
ncbi:hypothetical protein WJX77_009414 [Trebouxia sp. C0004]